MTSSGSQLLSPERPPSAMELTQSESRAAMRAARKMMTAPTSRLYGLCGISECERHGKHRRGALDDQRRGDDTAVWPDKRATRCWWSWPCRINVKRYIFGDLGVEKAGQRGKTVIRTQTHRTTTTYTRTRHACCKDGRMRLYRQAKSTHYAPIVRPLGHARRLSHAWAHLVSSEEWLLRAATILRDPSPVRPACRPRIAVKQGEGRGCHKRKGAR